MTLLLRFINSGKVMNKLVPDSIKKINTSGGMCIILMKT